VEPINYLAPPIKRCLKFMAPAVKKIEFLLIGHLFPVCVVFPVLSTSSPPLSHGEISRVCEIPAEILTFPALVENAPQSARSLEQSDVGPVCSLSRKVRRRSKSRDDNTGGGLIKSAKVWASRTARNAWVASCRALRSTQARSIGQ